MIIQTFSSVFLLVATLVCLYYFILTIVALIPRKRSKYPYWENATLTFAVVIPAHNEEKMILRALRSCEEQNYPKEKYKVYVVADNCTDRTAIIATEQGAICLERYDENYKGKGFALEWGFERILPEGQDAVVVLDADCTLDPHALRVFDYYLQKGEKVLQANYVVLNPDESPISYAVAVGNVIENDLFYAPKSELGLAVFLRGTGMVFRQDILARHPWQSRSIVEDSEYSLVLLRDRITVKFVKEVSVSSEFPSSWKQLKVQRTRWAGGNLGFAKTDALKLMLEGFAKGRFVLVDAGWTLLALSRPLVLLGLAIGLGLGTISAWNSPGPISDALLFTGLILLSAYGVYFGLGVLLLGVNLKRILLLLGTPAVVVKLIAISLFGLIGIDRTVWAQTPRN